VLLESRLCYMVVQSYSMRRSFIAIFTIPRRASAISLSNVSYPTFLLIDGLGAVGSTESLSLALCDVASCNRYKVSWRQRLYITTDLGKWSADKCKWAQLNHRFELPPFHRHCGDGCLDFHDVTDTEYHRVYCLEPLRLLLECIVNIVDVPTHRNCELLVVDNRR